MAYHLPPLGLTYLGPAVGVDPPPRHTSSHYMGPVVAWGQPTGQRRQGGQLPLMPGRGVVPSTHTL